jgi:hypothetical protein
MRRAARCLAASASAASLLIATAVAAAPAELEWHAPRGCPSRERVLSEVSRLVATAPTEPLRARAHVTRAGKGFRVTIELAGAARGVRTLRGRSCESIARATALIIALAIDPQAASVVSEQLEAPEPEPEEVRSVPAAPARPSFRPEPGPSPRGVLFLGFLGEHALVPRLALGTEAGAGLSWRFARGDIAVGVIPRARTALASHPSVGADFTLAFAALRSCAGLVGESAAVLGCAALRGSRIWARGTGASPSFEATANVFSVEPGVLIRVPGESGVSAELTANLVVPLSRPSFVIADAETERELFRPAAVGAVVKLAVSYEF